MKKIRVCVLLLVMIFLTGCSGVYNLTINEDLTITEDVVLSLEKQEETYDRVLNLINQYEIKEEDYSIVDKENFIQVKFVKNFISIEDYILNSKLYPELFNEIKFTNKDRVLTLNTESVFDLNTENREEVVDTFNIELLNINIETPLKVRYNNADEVNDDVYTWTVKNGDNNKKISLEINTSAVSNLYKPIIVIAVIVIIVLAFAVIAFINFRKSKKL